MFEQPNKRQAVLDALPATIPQIMRKASASRPTVCMWLSRLHVAGAIYVKSWRRTGGQCSPVYALGNLPDADKPVRRTAKQYARRTYLKNRQAVEKEARAKRNAARENADRMAKTRDPLVGFLFGMAA